MDSKKQLEYRKKLLNEITNLKNQYIQEVKNLQPEEILAPTIQFLDCLISYRKKDPEVDTFINKYWQLASTNYRLQCIEKQIKESKKGR